VLAAVGQLLQRHSVTPQMVHFSARICLSDCGVLKGFLEEFLRRAEIRRSNETRKLCGPPHPPEGRVVYRIVLIGLVILPSLGCEESPTDSAADKSVHPPGWYIPRDASLALYLAKSDDFLAALRSAADKKGGRFTTNSDGQLVELALVDTRVSADEFRRICGFVQLRSLYITCGAIDDSALTHVTSLSKLEVLGLDFNLITDHGVRHISMLRNLEEIDLREMPVTDEAVKSLCQIPNIRCLKLGGTRITDASIHQLKEIDTLKELWIYDTQITREGVESLRKALPDCCFRDEL